MSSPRNTLKVAPAEIRRIQELYVAGVRVSDIVRRTKRCESVVYRAVRGIKRRRPHPRAPNARRDAAIVELFVKHKHTLGEIASRYRLTTTRVCQIVRLARGLIAKKVPKSALVVPSALPDDPKVRRPLTREQTLARNRRIAELARDGVGMQRIANRFGISRQRVDELLRESQARARRRAQVEADRREMVRLARKGVGPTEIGRRFGLRKSSVQWVLRRAGVRPQTRRAKRGPS